MPKLNLKLRNDRFNEIGERNRESVEGYINKNSNLINNENNFSLINNNIEDNLQITKNN